jgi:3-oxoadipate enol-lactonase
VFEIALKNHRTEYQIQGEGPQTIVLVHGLSFDKAGWGPFAEQLAKHFRVVSFDARGVGVADGVYANFTTKEMAADAIELIEKLQIKNPIVLGFSMGGMVAQHIGAMMKPGSLRALVLLSTAQRSSNRSSELLRLWRDMIIAGVDRSIIYRDQFLWANEPAFFEKDGAVQETLDYLFTNPAKQSTAGFVAQANACIAHDGEKACAAIPMNTPTLILVGPEERVFSVADSERLSASIQQSKLIVLPAGGHNAWLEHPEEVGRLLIAALARHLEQ